MSPHKHLYIATSQIAQVVYLIAGICPLPLSLAPSSFHSLFLWGSLHLSVFSCTLVSLAPSHTVCLSSDVSPVRLSITAYTLCLYLCPSCVLWVSLAFFLTRLAPLSFFLNVSAFRSGSIFEKEPFLLQKRTTPCLLNNTLSAGRMYLPLPIPLATHAKPIPRCV